MLLLTHKLYSFTCNIWQRKKNSISALIKPRVGDDGVPAILQYRPSDLYLTDRKQTMTILRKDIGTSLVHPYLPTSLLSNKKRKLVEQSGMVAAAGVIHPHASAKSDHQSRAS